MFKYFAKSRRPEWYPGQRAINDRWGTPVGATVSIREFRTTSDPQDTVVNAMRWSVG